MRSRRLIARMVSTFAFAVVSPLLVAAAASAAPTQVIEYGAGSVGAPRELVVEPGDGLWFTEGGLGAIGHVTAGGAITSYSEGLEGADPTGLIVGPGGDIWFGLRVSSERSYIGRIDAGGAVTLYGSLRTHTSPKKLAVGPEGNVWFVSNAGRRPSIGYVTPLGAVSQFELPGHPHDLAAAPGANMWFTYREEGSAAIGDVALTEGGGATITLFHSGLGAESSPEELIAGPDGDLWFTDTWGEAIGSVTPDGAIGEFSVLDRPQQIVPVEGGFWIRGTYGLARATTAGAVDYVEVPPFGEGRRPRDIALGPEGDLWFAAEGATADYETTGTVGRITPAGKVTAYTASLPAGSQPDEIVAGEDSDLWFADNGSTPAIGRIIPGEDPEPSGPSGPAPSSPTLTRPRFAGGGTIVLGAHDIGVARGGALRIPVTCDEGSICAGRVTLTAFLPRGGKHGAAKEPIIAAREFSVAGISPTTTWLRLNRRGRRLLVERRGHLRAIATFWGRLPKLAGSHAFGLRLYSVGK